MENLGKRIKILRIERGILQKDLAKKVGISSNYISLLEGGKRSPSYRTLKKIAGALGMPTSRVISDIEDDKKNEILALFQKLEEILDRCSRIK